MCGCWPRRKPHWAMRFSASSRVRIKTSGWASSTASTSLLSSWTSPMTSMSGWSLITAKTSSRINRGRFATKTRTRFTRVILTEPFYFLGRAQTRVNCVLKRMFKGGHTCTAWVHNCGTNLHLVVVLICSTKDCEINSTYYFAYGTNIVLIMVLVSTPVARTRFHAGLVATLPHRRRNCPRTGGAPERLAQASRRVGLALTADHARRSTSTRFFDALGLPRRRPHRRKPTITRTDRGIGNSKSDEVRLAR